MTALPFAAVFGSETMLSQRKRQHLRYLYRGGGLPAVLTWLVQAFLSPLYYREARHVLARKVPERNSLGSTSRGEGNVEGECIIVESPEALRAVEGEIPSSLTYSLESLQKHLAQGCVVFLIFCPKETRQGRAFVGYGIYQRDMLFVLGREKVVPLNILCSRYHEMLPEYRGQRYSDAMRFTRDEYCRKHGVKFLCGTAAPDNRPSLKSVLTRGGYQIVGTAVRVSILRGRFVWETPWEKIEAALRDFFLQERQG